MTDEEKQIFKAMNKFTWDTLFQISLYKAIVEMNVPTWPSVVASLTSSPAIQKIQKELENGRQAIELLIDENNLTALQSAISNIDPPN
jgi:hypothetical protein